MTVGTGTGPETVLPARGTAGGMFASLRDPAAWMRTQDGLAILLIVVLPWSTSAVAILATLFALALLPTLDFAALTRSLKAPASVTALLLVVLAALGTLWAIDAASADRFRGVGQLAKLLMIPLLLYHVQRSSRGSWMMTGFAASCTVLLTWSWVSWLVPGVAVLSPANMPGVPVKNYIAQSQEFALCAFALAGLAWRRMQAGQIRSAVALALLSVAFIGNMLFVVTARTALVYLPVLLVLFAVCHLKWRAMLLATAAMAAVAALVWMTSPYLRERVTNIGGEYELYKDKNAVTSTGQRLEYWRKSLKFIADAPIAGHGTGATRQLFEKDAVGQTGVSAEVIGNPHNQTLNVAVQWGLLGVLALYAMWLAHLRLFLGRNLFAWIGLAAVAENVASSLLNSHITDFNEGWLYVLAVGVAGGLVMKSPGRAPDAAT